MDLNEFDPVSMAGRAAHVAASEIYGLLTTGKPGAVPGWAGRDGVSQQQTVDHMANYVCGHDVYNPEVLFIQALSQGWATGAPSRAWAEQSFARREAFTGFVLVARHVHQRIAGAQKRAAELAAREARRKRQTKIPLEDTIYEPVDSLNALRPESVAAEKIRRLARAAGAQPAASRSEAGAAQPRGASAKDGPRSPARGEKTRPDDLTRLTGVDKVLGGELKKLGIDTFAAISAMSAATARDLEKQIDFGGGRIKWGPIIRQARALSKASANTPENQPAGARQNQPAGARQKQPAGARQKMSIGETPARRPVNKGGRGKKKN